MIEGDSLICLGYAASMSSAGMWPLITWLVQRGYIDVLASTSANISEDLLDMMDGARVYRVDPEHVDDVALADKGYYRFYDHIVSSKKYDQMETVVTGRFFDELADTWRKPTIPTVRLLFELGNWLNAKGFEKSILRDGGAQPGARLLLRLAGRPDRRGLQHLAQGRAGARRRLLQGLPDRHGHHGQRHDVEAGNLRRLPGRWGAEGFPADHRDQRADPPRQRGSHPAQGLDPDHDRQHGLRRLGGATLATECISWEQGGARERERHVLRATSRSRCRSSVRVSPSTSGRDHRREQPKPLKLAEVF